MANSDPEAIDSPETSEGRLSGPAELDAAKHDAAAGTAAANEPASKPQAVTPERPRVQPVVLLPRATRFSRFPPEASAKSPLRRYAPAAAVVLLIGATVVATRLLGGHDAHAVSASAPASTGAVTAPLLEPDRQLAQMPAEIDSLSATVETLRSKINTMQAGADKTAASVDILRANLDHGRSNEEAATLRKSLDALKQSLAETNATTAAQLGQMAQKLDRQSPDVAGKLAQVVDRLDRLERDQTTRLAQIGTRLDRLEHASAASADVTGSIAKAPLPTPAPTPAAAPPPSPKQQTVPDLRVLGVGYGAAMIESRNGAVFHVAQGEYIPGLGRVLSIERRGHGWYVVTAHGTVEPLSR